MGIDTSRYVAASNTQRSFFKPKVKDSHLPVEVTANSGNVSWKLMMPSHTPPHILPTPQGLLVVRERPLLVKKKRCKE